MLGQYQNQIQNLPSLNRFRYERIFRLYTTENSQYFYNLLQKIDLPSKIDETKLYYLVVRQNEPWTLISYNAYQTIELWWLICLLNKIDNPLVAPKSGQVLTLLRPQYLTDIFNEIDNLLK
jgi:hypothetical protein